MSVRTALEQRVELFGNSIDDSRRLPTLSVDRRLVSVIAIEDRLGNSGDPCVETAASKVFGRTGRVKLLGEKRRDCRHHRLAGRIDLIRGKIIAQHHPAALWK